MKSESSLGKILWSVAYLCLAAVALKVAITSLPLRVGAALQQDQRKSFEQAFSSNPIVRVTKLKIGPNSRQFKEEFDESDDWLKRFVFEIESMANKPITYLEVNLNFPETKASGNLMSYPIAIGINPNPNPKASPTAQKALRLMPGEKLAITLADDYDKLERFISIRHSINQIHKAQVEVSFIVFDDGTAWIVGDYFRRDPNNPRHYINVGQTPPK
jgi:hypothetical protein